MHLWLIIGTLILIIKKKTVLSSDTMVLDCHITKPTQGAYALIGEKKMHVKIHNHTLYSTVVTFGKLTCGKF